jgi:stage II sporulation protein R
MTFKKKCDILTVSMLIGTVVTLMLASFASFAERCENVQGEVLRLHILPNSDSADDQSLKYLLRDFIIGDAKTHFAGAADLNQALQKAAGSLDKMEKNAKNFIKAQGYGYDVKISIENMFFTTRTYENITMPAGNYDALRVVIGAGEGDNWWCVIFPPLCLPACTKKASGEPYFSVEASRIIESGGGRAEVRFWIYEWLTGRLQK